ncbi:hypothetical protein [Poriferisphaera corsica]|uniref:hypothetical protein n=1 Tax=Poriferisphaera corsica TaxID=2528020 RepID=UPI00190DAC84|nr:hypothetical protein [Poriferisphaera corsica]
MYDTYRQRIGDRFTVYREYTRGPVHYRDQKIRREIVLQIDTISEPFNRFPKPAKVMTWLDHPPVLTAVDFYVREQSIIEQRWRGEMRFAAPKEFLLFNHVDDTVAIVPHEVFDFYHELTVNPEPRPYHIHSGETNCLLLLSGMRPRVNDYFIRYATDRSQLPEVGWVPLSKEAVLGYLKRVELFEGAMAHEKLAEDLMRYATIGKTQRLAFMDATFSADYLGDFKGGSSGRSKGGQNLKGCDAADNWRISPTFYAVCVCITLLPLFMLHLYRRRLTRQFYSARVDAMI